MRILSVSAFFEGHGGGIEIVAGALARALARTGCESRWAAASLDLAPGDGLIKTIPLRAVDPLERFTGLPMPLLLKEGRQALREQVRQADAVIVHDALYASSLAAAHFAQEHNKPWMLVQHIGAIPYKKSILRMAMAAANGLATRPMLTRASQAVFISTQVSRYFGEVAFRRPPMLIFNGVETALFRPPEEQESRGLRRRFGLDESRKQLLFVGRFVEKKGLSILRHLAAAHSAWDVVMAGDGPLDPSSWNLPNVVVLGRLGRSDLALLYRAANALVLPSVGEGYPLVIQEAMASGLPVFCGTDSAQADPGAACFLHGLEVDVGDPKGTADRFAQAIALSRDASARDMATYARNTYDWDANARRIATHLQGLRHSAS